MEMTYKEFIDNILETRGRFNCGEEYHERHHIVPKCMGGTNEEENLIDLFAREHFEAHRLLALENLDNDSLILAWTMMAWAKNDNEQRYEVTAEEYEFAKIALSQIQSKLKSGCNNPMYGKTTIGNTGKKASAKTRKKMSDSHKNPSEETRRKMSEGQKERWTDELKEEWGNKMSKEGNPFYGKRHSEKTKNKIREANSKPIICVETGIIYKSATKAAKFANVSKSTIGKCCKGKKKTAGGYIWKYLYDQTCKDGTIIPGAITLGLITEEEASKILEEQKNTEGEN